MGGTQRKQLVCKVLHKSTNYSQKLVIVHVHIVEEKPMAPASLRGRRTVQHSVKNVINVGGPGTFREFANQRRKLVLKKLLQTVLTLRQTK